MSRYAYARGHEDWANLLARQLKTALKAIILRLTLEKFAEDRIRARCADEISEFLSEFNDEEQDEREYFARELQAFTDEAIRMTAQAVGGLSAYKFAQAIVGAGQFRKETKQASPSLVVTVSENAEKVGSMMMRQPLTDSAYNFATANETFYGDVQKEITDFMRDYETFSKSKTYSRAVNPRNIAEMTSRYNSQREELKRLREAGVKLVYIPPHANCSARCQPFQGRIYSLDGTSGTHDGNRFVPIEDVSDKVTRTSPITGKVYPNGLFSYNCRHTAKRYREGQVVETIPAEVIARQRAIEENQREMEREIRTVAEKRLMLEQVANASDKEVPELEKEIAKWKRQELGMIRAYEKYTKTNNLVSVRDRLKVVPGEDRINRLGEPKEPAD